jgi:hypothetical protein
MGENKRITSDAILFAFRRPQSAPQLLHDVSLVLARGRADNAAHILINSGGKAPTADNPLRFLSAEPLEDGTAFRREGVDVIKLDSLGLERFLIRKSRDPPPRENERPVAWVIALLTRSQPCVNYVG